MASEYLKRVFCQVLMINLLHVKLQKDGASLTGTTICAPWSFAVLVKQHERVDFHFMLCL